MLSGLIFYFHANTNQCVQCIKPQPKIQLEINDYKLRDYYYNVTLRESRFSSSLNIKILY